MTIKTVAALLVALLAFIPAAGRTDTVVLLHGLARTSDSMTKMSRALETAGYRVCNVSYPSREHSIEVLTKDFVLPAVRACVTNQADGVHFVTRLAASSCDSSRNRRRQSDAFTCHVERT